MRPLTIEKEELESMLLKVVRKQTPHDNYQHTVDIAKFCKQIVTGDDHKELLISYKKSENAEQQKQRINLYNSRTRFLSNKIISVFSEIERADNVVDVLQNKSENTESKRKLIELNLRLNYFYHNDTLKKYLFETIRHLNFVDPNAFLVTEYENAGKGKPWTYPLEVYAGQAYNFKYKNGVLQWLITRHEKKIIESSGRNPAEKGVERVGYKYTIYGPQWSFVLEELGKEEELKAGAVEKMITLAEDKEDTRFSYASFNTKNPFCPAIRVGYIMDASTDRKTCVSPLHPAEHVFRKLIKETSEDDLAMAIHGFLQKFAYVPKCDNRNTTEGVCMNGTMSITDETCKVCKGEGILVHKTVQDVVLIQKPEDREEHIPMNQMVHYVSIPTELIKLRKDDIRALEQDVSLAVFNSNKFERDTIAQTATAKRLELTSVYNVFSDYTENWVKLYKHFVWITAHHVDFSREELTVEYGFPSDYKLETLTDLIEMRSASVTAGAPYPVIHSIDMSILAKQHRDDPAYIDKIKSRERVRPFREKALNERMFIISSLPEDNHFRVLSTYFEEIMTEIEEEKESFYKMKAKDQQKIVEDKVTDWKERYEIAINTSQPSLGDTLGN